MKYKVFLEKANKLAKEFPSTLEMEVINASDDEGNSYHKVSNTPCIAQVEDIKKYNLELVGFFYEDQKHQPIEEQDIALPDCNVVCIN